MKKRTRRTCRDMDIFDEVLSKVTAAQAQKQKKLKTQADKQARAAAQLQQEMDRLITGATTTVRKLLGGKFQAYLQQLFSARGRVHIDHQGISKFPLPELMLKPATEVPQNFQVFAGEETFVGNLSDNHVSLLVLPVWAQDTSISVRHLVLALVCKGVTASPTSLPDIHFILVEHDMHAAFGSEYSKINGSITIPPELMEVLRKLQHPRTALSVFFEEFGFVS